MGSIYSDLVDKGNFGINKSLPTLPDHSLCSRVRCVDTNFLRIFTLDLNPISVILYLIEFILSVLDVSPFGDIILVYGKEYAIKPVVLE